MALPAAPDRVSAEAYLAWERDQPGRHEFHRGAIFAMAGGSPRHNLLGVALGAELRAALRGRGCHTLSSDQRISLEGGDSYVYADAVAVCGKLETLATANDVLLNPTIVVEVLSPATEAYDRGVKWAGYARSDSLTDYLLVAQASAQIEHYSREADGSWRYRLLGPGGIVTLANGGQIAVDAVYDGAFEVEGG